MGRDFGRTRNYSEEVAAEIDAEMQRIINNAYETAIGLLERHKPALHGLAKALLEKETLNEDEFRELFEKFTAEGVEDVPDELAQVKELDDRIQTELGKVETEGEEQLEEREEERAGDDKQSLTRDDEE